MAPSVSSNDLMMGTLVCMLGPLNLNRGSMGTPGSQMGQGSTGGGSMGGSSSGQGSMGQGSSGQGSMGQGSSGQGSMGQGSAGGSTMSGSSAEACVTIAQATNVMPTALALGDASAIDTVRKQLDGRLTAEGATPDVSSNTLAFFDKGVAAAKEARTADDAIYGGMSPRGVGGGPSSGSSHGHGGTGSSKPDTSKQSSSARAGSDEIRAHRALGDLYQFGRNLGTTQTGSEAQALAWIIAIDRFETVTDLPVQQKALAAEPLFAVMFNVPAPTGARASNWQEYLAAAARSAGSSTGGGTPSAVGGGPATANDKANLRQVARGAEERLQVLGQQLPPSSALRPEVDRTIADLRKIEAAAQSGQGTQQQRSTPKKPPAQNQPSQPSQPSQQQQQQNQKKQK
jgi:hypothetical protein